jgi:hypothetical protein
MNASSLRPRAGNGLVMTVAHRLTQRDRIISTMLSRHRVVTTDQLAEMYFDNLNIAQHRLTTLFKLRLVERFQSIDHRCASLPYHYVCDQLWSPPNGARTPTGRAGGSTRRSPSESSRASGTWWA